MLCVPSALPANRVTAMTDNATALRSDSPAPRTVRSPRGSTLHCRSWLTEAAFRMLQNNLDPEVAENPLELVVYGGIGKACLLYTSPSPRD